MSDDNWYLEALQNYLNSSDWRDTIRVFVVANCPFFSDVTDLHPQQHVVWKSFQDIVENILENALVDVGGSIDQLERSLDDVMSRPSRGPRDEVIKDVLHKLMSFDDFRVFGNMMHGACEEEIGGDLRDINANPHNTLMRMGFSAVSIISAMDHFGEHYSLEELMHYLGEQSLSNSPNRSSKQASISSKSSKSRKMQAVEEQEMEEITQYPHPAALTKFITEASSEGVLIDGNDFRSKFRIADSLVEVYKQNHDVGEIDLKTIGASQCNNLDSDKMLDLVKWAAEMQALLQDIHIAYFDRVPCKSIVLHHSHGLIAFYSELESAFQSASKNSLMGGNEMDRLKELDRIAAEGNSDEQYLYSCLNNHENISREVAKLYKKCSIIMMTNPEIQSTDMEEIYLFLKDQMDTDQMDSVNIYDNIQHHAIFSRLNKDRSGLECIQLLLDLHLLEEEMVFLKQEIQRLVGSPSKAAAMEGMGFGFADAADHSINFHMLDDLTEISGSASMMASDSKPDAKEADRTVASAKDVDSKATAFSHSSPVRVALTSPPAYDHLLDGLKESHRDALKTLKDNLFNHKNGALQSLEERLLRKKLLRKSMLDSKSGVDGLELDEINAELAALELDIDGVNASYNTMNGHILESYRDKCIHELREAKGLLERCITDGSVHSIKDMADVVRKDSSIQSNVNNSTAASIKNRYLEERDRLLANMEHQRHQQRSKLQALLQARKGSAAANEQWYASEIEKGNAVIDGQFGQSMGELTQEYIYTMAATKLDSAMLAGQPDAAQDSYLQDITGTSNGSDVTNYLQRIEAMKQAYVTANANLYNSLLAKKKNYGKDKHNANSEEADGGLENGAMEVMSQVVMDAYDAHLGDVFDNITKRSTRMPSTEDYNDRARIGILEAFEKAKMDLNNSQSAVRAAAQARLAMRKKNGTTNAVEAMATIEGMLEGVMDSFLEQPAAAYSGKGYGHDGKYDDSLDKDKRDQIRRQHNDKQKALVSSLSLQCVFETDMYDPGG